MLFKTFHLFALSWLLDILWKRTIIRQMKSWRHFFNGRTAAHLNVQSSSIYRPKPRSRDLFLTSLEQRIKLPPTIARKSTKHQDTLYLRWLKTVSSTFQDVDFDGSLSPLFISWCYNHSAKKLPNHWWTRWYYFRDTVGYHSNTMACWKHP